MSGRTVAYSVGVGVAALARTSVLPGAADFEAAMPPVSSAFVRRVPDQKLWIWYR